MRKFFSLESEDIDPPAIEDDEVQVALDESRDTAQSVDQDLVEAERIIEISDALEDLAVIADGIEEATPAEVALVEAAGQMAVAGTDVAPEEIVPAMEGYVGRTISTEGIREIAAKILESLKQAEEDIWNKFEKYYDNMFSTFPHLRKKVEKLKAELSELKDGHTTPSEAKVKISSGIKTLSINYKPVSSEADVKNGLKTLIGCAEMVYGDYINATIANGKHIASALDAFDPDQPQVAADKLIENLKKAQNSLPGLKKAPSTKYPGFDVKVSDQLFGNVVLTSIGFEHTSKDDNVLAILDRYRRTRYELISSDVKRQPSAKSAEMHVMSIAAMEDTLSQLIKLIDVLEGFKRGSKLKEAQTVRSMVERASEKAETAVSKKNTDKEAFRDAAIPYYKALVNFNTAYARWVQTPAIPYLNHSVTVMHALISLLSKNIAAYKK